jgi:hypothetical protein
VEQLAALVRPSWWRRHSFVLATAGLFLAAWFGQFYFQANAFAEDVREHGGRPGWGDFWNEFLAATFTNWQAEFLQLCWQAAGLALLYHWRHDRMGRQVDELRATQIALTAAIARMNMLLASADGDDEP